MWPVSMLVSGTLWIENRFNGLAFCTWHGEMDLATPDPAQIMMFRTKTAQRDTEPDGAGSADWKFGDFDPAREPWAQLCGYQVGASH